MKRMDLLKAALAAVIAALFLYGAGARITHRRPSQTEALRHPVEAGLVKFWKKDKVNGKLVGCSPGGKNCMVVPLPARRDLIVPLPF